MTDPASMTVIDVYQRHGLVWSGLRGDRLSEGAWLDRFCGLLPAGATVLDIGCGSGLPIPSTCSTGRRSDVHQWKR